jgi:maltoporin
MNSAYLRLLVVLAISAHGGLTHAKAADAELEKLKAQLDAIKTNYEKQIQELERRISELEATAGKTSAAALAASKRALTNAEAIEIIQRKLQAGATETRDVYRDDAGWPFDLKRLYDLPRPLEFHGYLRSGFGLNGEGGKMEAFKAPGAGAKYRLGNESDTYGEVGLTHNWLRADDPLKSPYVRTTVMFSFSTAENFTYDSLNNQAQGNDFALRQAFVEGGNVIQSVPDMRFWAGQRYYQRHDIHINDFYFLDMSGYGGGVEDVPVGNFGKVALAWLGGSVDGYETDHGDVAKQNIDLRLYDVTVPLGKLTLWLNYANTRGGEVNNVFNPGGTPLQIQSSSGWAVGLIHRTLEEKLWGGYNEFSIQYGEGAAYNFASTLDSSGPDLDDASRFRVTDQITIQPWRHFSMQLVGLYEDTKYGGPNSRNLWASTGVRPIYHFNDRFSVALETGVDWTKSDPLGTEGSLWKITLAPQVSRGGRFFSRPVIRLFVTYAVWSDDFKGLVGGTPYANATDGLSYGIQAEAWW